MKEVQLLIKSTDDTPNHDLGAMSAADGKHWVFGDDNHFPIQIDQLADDQHLLVYGTFVKSTGEPIYTSLMTSMMLENMTGATLSGYGICSGPVTFTIYSKMAVATMTPQQMVELVTGMRQLIEYIRMSTSMAVDDVDVSDNGTIDHILPSGHVH